MGSHIGVHNVNAWYGNKQALKSVSLEIPQNSIYAFIGPSGCGKTTLLRSINRLNDLIAGFRLEGEIHVGDTSVYRENSNAHVQNLRKSIGMVFQQPNPLPISILQNMLLPISEHTWLTKSEITKLAVEKLKAANIYDEVNDRLHKNALTLSGGQQQRLCIARALMLEPNIMLFDEPCAALDPISTAKIEELLLSLKGEHTIVIVTHNMEQACRISDYTSFFYEGEIIESGATLEVFRQPKTKLMEQYITGRM